MKKKNKNKKHKSLYSVLKGGKVRLPEEFLEKIGKEDDIFFFWPKKRPTWKSKVEDGNVTYFEKYNNPEKAKRDIELTKGKDVRLEEPPYFDYLTEIIDHPTKKNLLKKIKRRIMYIITAGISAISVLASLFLIKKKQKQETAQNIK